MLPDRVGFGDDVLAQSRRDRRIVSVAITVGALTCAAFVATRADVDQLHPITVAQAARATRLPEQVGLGVYPIAVASDSAPPTTARPTGAPVAFDYARGSRPVVHTARTALSPSTAIAVAVAVVDSAAAYSAASHTSSRVAVESVDTAIASTAAADVLVRKSHLSLSAAVELTAPEIRVARAIVAPLLIAPAADIERLDSSDVRSSVARFAASLRTRANTSADLIAFYADGAEHHAEYVLVAGSEPTSASERAAFEIKLSRYDAVGRRVTRILPVSMLVTKRDGVVRTSAVTFGALRKP